MNKKYIYGGVLVLLIILLLTLTIGKDESIEEPREEVNGEVSLFEMKDVGLAFGYAEGEYVLEEKTSESSDNDELKKHIILTPYADYQDAKNREGGEGSPHLSLMVYENVSKESPSVWIDNNKSASNIDLAITVPKEEVVAGANALSYTIDGLYLTDVYVIASNGYIYVASSSYIDDQSKTIVDFKGWLDSFTFIPTEGNDTSNLKLDIKAVCENALIYMTFENGEAADAFVNECVEGKHPEVIERYIKDNNLEGATI